MSPHYKSNLVVFSANMSINQVTNLLSQSIEGNEGMKQWCIYLHGDLAGCFGRQNGKGFSNS